jgi:hypothetical protein
MREAIRETPPSRRSISRRRSHLRLAPADRPFFDLLLATFS